MKDFVYKRCLEVIDKFCTYFYLMEKETFTEPKQIFISKFFCSEITDNITNNDFFKFNRLLCEQFEYLKMVNNPNECHYLEIEAKAQLCLYLFDELVNELILEKPFIGKHKRRLEDDDFQLVHKRKKV